MTRFSNWDCREKRTQGLKWEDRGWTHSSSGSHIESLCGAVWLAHFLLLEKAARQGRGACESQSWQWRRPCKQKVFSTYEQKGFMVNSVTRRFSLLFLVKEDNGTVLRTKHSTCTWKQNGHSPRLQNFTFTSPFLYKDSRLNLWRLLSFAPYSCL